MTTGRTRFPVAERRAMAESAALDALEEGAPLRVRLLGRFGIVAHGREVGEDGWRVRKAKSVVKLLSLTAGHRLDRDALIDHLWPDLEPASAANNLRVTLHAARGVMGHDTLISRGSAVVLSQDGDVWVDAEVFESAARAAARTREPGAYAAALDLYQGDLLPEDRFEDWTAGRRERLRDLFHTTLERSAALYDDIGDVARARATRERLAASDPTHEPARVWLMRSYAASGERPRALRHYEGLAAALRSELDARPDPETERLHREIAGANAVLMPRSETGG